MCGLGEDFYRFFTLVAMATRILHGTQLFERGPPLEHSSEIW